MASRKPPPPVLPQNTRRRNDSTCAKLEKEYKALIEKSPLGKIDSIIQEENELAKIVDEACAQAIENPNLTLADMPGILEKVQHYLHKKLKEIEENTRKGPSH